MADEMFFKKVDMEKKIRIPSITVNAEVVFFEDEQPEEFKLYNEQTKAAEDVWRDILNNEKDIFQAAQFTVPGENGQTIILSPSTREGVDWQLSFIGKDGIPVMHENYYKNDNPNGYKANNEDGLISTLINYSLQGKEIIARVLYEGEQIMAEQNTQGFTEEKDFIEFQSASISNYEGYVVLAQFDRDEPHGDERIYLGKSENYNGMGTYDNTDGSLVYISDNKKMFNFLCSTGWIFSQQQLIDKGIFTAEDYAEFANLKEIVLKQFTETREIKFGIDVNKLSNSGVPFEYPDWGEKNKNQNKKRLFVDMDGTLARFHDEAQYLERMYEEGFFANLRPFENVVEGIREFIRDNPDVEVYALSSVIDSEYCVNEKNQWLDKYLPEIPVENRIYPSVGSSKSDYVQTVTGRLITADDFLLDDYTVNLLDWQSSGRGIKLLNAINHTNGSWQNDRIRFDREPSDLAKGLATVILTDEHVYDERVEQQIEVENVSNDFPVYVAIESTEDYTDTNFHQSLVDVDIQNPDGSYGRIENKYRLVVIGEEGYIVPVDDRVFDSVNEATDALLATPNYHKVEYDDMVTDAINIIRDKSVSIAEPETRVKDLFKDDSLSAEDVRKDMLFEQVKQELDSRNIVMENEKIEENINEYFAHGNSRNADDIADFIESSIADERDFYLENEATNSLADQLTDFIFENDIEEILNYFSEVIDVNDRENAKIEILDLLRDRETEELYNALNDYLNEWSDSMVDDIAVEGYDILSSLGDLNGYIEEYSEQYSNNIETQENSKNESFQITDSNNAPVYIAIENIDDKDDKYRFVRIGSDGKIVPLDNRIFNSLNEANEAGVDLSTNSNYRWIVYEQLEVMAQEGLWAIQDAQEYDAAINSLANRIEKFAYDNDYYNYNDATGIDDDARNANRAEIERYLVNGTRTGNDDLNHIADFIRETRDSYQNGDEGTGNFAIEIREANDLLYTLENLQEYIDLYDMDLPETIQNAEVPINEFYDTDGRILEGERIPIEHAGTSNSNVDRSLVYNAVKKFEEDNNISESQREIQPDGTFADADSLYMAYDRYVGMSHQSDLSIRAYRENMDDILADHNIEANNLLLIAEIYYAQQNGLSNEQIDYALNAAKDAFPVATMKNIRHGFERGLSVEQLDVVLGEDSLTQEYLIDFMANGGSIDNAQALKGADSALYYTLNGHLSDGTISPENAHEIIKTINYIKEANRADYANKYIEMEAGRANPRFTTDDFDYMTEALVTYVVENPTVNAEDIEMVGSEFWSQNKTNDIREFINKKEAGSRAIEEVQQELKDRGYEVDSTMISQEYTEYVDSLGNDYSLEKLSNFIENREFVNNDIGEDDLFFNYPNQTSVEAVYFNPNSASGGQLVMNTLSYELIFDAQRNTQNEEEFWEYLDEFARQELVDIDSNSFKIYATTVNNRKPDFVGRTEESMNRIIAAAEFGRNFDEASSFYNVHLYGTRYENHAAELVYCYQNNKSIEEFDEWVAYQDVLGEKISFDEYKNFDSRWDADILNLNLFNPQEVANVKAWYERFKNGELKENENKVNGDVEISNNHREDDERNESSERSNDMAKDKTETNTSKGVSLPEEKKDAKEQLNEQLQEGIKRVLDSENYRNWLDTSSKLFLNNYSFNNAILVWLQNPEATYTMGFEQWKDYGRNVAKGAKGIKIFVPVIAYEKSDGYLWNMIKNNLQKQLRENPSLDRTSYRIGVSKIEITSNRNGIYGLVIGGKEVGLKTEKEMKDFIKKNVINKIPMYFTVGTVFNYADTVEPEYLWVKKGYTKDELVRDENGKPIKNRKGEYKIVNTPERKAKFQPNLDMSVPQIDEEKAGILYDSLKKISERNGIHVYEKIREEDKELRGGADGYFSRQFTPENPKGFIVMPTDLDPTRRVSVMLHEMGHSDMHGDLKKIAEQMGENYVPSQMRELQAESVAYLVGKNFGLSTETSSFQYLAAYTEGFELQALSKSIEIIYNECKQLTNELKAELEARGLNMDLSERNEKVMDAESIKTISKAYITYAIEQENRISDIEKELPVLAAQNKGKENILSVIVAQNVNVKHQGEDIIIIKDLVDELKKADTLDKQQNCIAAIEAAKERVENYKKDFTDLTAQFQEVSRDEKNLKNNFVDKPEATIESMKQIYPKLENLYTAQVQYLAKSEYVKNEISTLLRSDPQQFVDKAYERASQIDKVVSKNGVFVEITFCEQWTDKPIVAGGTLMHPKVADTIIKQAETQIRSLKAKAQNMGEYFPYSKCDLMVYKIENGQIATALKTRVDIGDGTQLGLTDHLKDIPGAEKIADDFEKATSEKGTKDRILFNKTLDEKVQEKLAKETRTSDRDISREGKEHQISVTKEHQSYRQEQSHKTTNKSKNDRER